MNKTQIAIALIGLAGTLGAALIANWDRLFSERDRPAAEWVEQGVEAERQAIAAELQRLYERLPEGPGLRGAVEELEARLSELGGTGRPVPREPFPEQGRPEPDAAAGEMVAEIERAIGRIEDERRNLLDRLERTRAWPLDDPSRRPAIEELEGRLRELDAERERLHRELEAQAWRR